MTKIDIDQEKIRRSTKIVKMDIFTPSSVFSSNNIYILNLQHLQLSITIILSPGTSKISYLMNRTTTYYNIIIRGPS